MNQYEHVERVISDIPKKEIVIVTGDFNAKVGKTENDNQRRKIVGKYGFG